MSNEAPEANIVVRFLLFIIGLFCIFWGGANLYTQRLLVGWTKQGNPTRLEMLVRPLEKLPYSWAIVGIIMIPVGIFFLKKAYEAEDILEEYNEPLTQQ